MVLSRSRGYDANFYVEENVALWSKFWLKFHCKDLKSVILRMRNTI